MKTAISTITAILLGLLTSLLVAWAWGDSPFVVMMSLLKGGFGSLDNFAYSLFYATPLIFTGLSVLLMFHLGLFNIGAEGQLHIAACFVIAGALSLKLQNFGGSIACVALAILGGGLWGLIAGAMRAIRGAHEVIVTILLNFISYGLLSLIVFHLYKNTNTVNPETLEVAESLWISPIHFLSTHSPLNYSLFLAIASAVCLHFILFHTTWGFQVRLVGGATQTAAVSGVPVRRRIMQAFFLAGAFSGLVAINDILGFSHKLKEGFSAGFGFTGIAVALLARKRPLNVLWAALLFGALHKGSLSLEFDTQHITRDLASVFQALVILFVAGFSLVFEKILEKHELKKHQKEAKA